MNTHFLYTFLCKSTFVSSLYEFNEDRNAISSASVDVDIFSFKTKQPPIPDSFRYCTYKYIKTNKFNSSAQY